MELLCPDCLAPLESSDGQTARCTTHGGQYQILFSRVPLAIPAQVHSPPPVPSQTGVACAYHPSVAAAFICGRCNSAICVTCDFPQPDGSHICPNCITQQAAFAPPPLSSQVPMPEGVRCVQHPNSPATARCKVCGGFMCPTCTFDLPGGVKICPKCATATPKLSPKRKAMLIGSYALAVWCTVFFTAMMAGVFRGFVTDKESQQLLGIAIMLFLMVPSLVGVALGVSSMDRRLPNTIAMWVAITWNGLILGGFILLMIIGILKGGG